jgi:hypothetical protein
MLESEAGKINCLGAQVKRGWLAIPACLFLLIKNSKKFDRLMSM